MAGVGYINVAPEMLVHFMSVLPTTYKVVGSVRADDHVRLALWSSEFAYDGIEMTCEVSDAGSTRTIKLKPTGRGE